MIHTLACPTLVPASRGKKGVCAATVEHDTRFNVSHSPPASSPQANVSSGQVVVSLPSCFPTFFPFDSSLSLSSVLTSAGKTSSFLTTTVNSRLCDQTALGTGERMQITLPQFSYFFVVNLRILKEESSLHARFSRGGRT